MAERINLFVQTIIQQKASHFKKTKKFVTISLRNKVLDLVIDSGGKGKKGGGGMGRKGGGGKGGRARKGKSEKGEE